MVGAGEAAQPPPAHGLQAAQGRRPAGGGRGHVRPGRGRPVKAGAGRLGRPRRVERGAQRRGQAGQAGGHHDAARHAKAADHGHRARVGVARKQVRVDDQGLETDVQVAQDGEGLGSEEGGGGVVGGGW